MEKRILSDEEIAFLDQYRHNWDTLRQAGYIGHLLLETREQFLKIARRFDNRYLACLTCPEDISALVRYVYTQADKDAPPANPEPPEPIVIEPNGPEVPQETEPATEVTIPNDTPPATGSEADETDAAPSRDELSTDGLPEPLATMLTSMADVVDSVTANQAKQTPAPPAKPKPSKQKENKDEAKSKH